MTGSEILKLKLKSRDVKAKTIGEYLQALLLAVLAEGESFSGKRPFGNSGWEHDLYRSLVAGGAIKGNVDDDGYASDFDKAAAHKAINSAIKAAFA